MSRPGHGRGPHLFAMAKPRSGRERSDDADAFIADPGDGPARTDDELAEEVARDFLQAATTGRGLGDEIEDEPTDEERGGPFIVTSGEDELAAGTDAPNPPEGMREPLPRATGAPDPAATY